MRPATARPNEPRHLVSPGLVFVEDADSPINTDGSTLKFVESPGIVMSGMLTLTTNPTIATRVDVIECSRNPAVPLEVDNRDIFNNVTGLFTTAAVTKVQEDQLLFRVRTGTPGGGYPGSVPEWLPLAVMAVPPGALGLDVCELWDVRPLESDLQRAPFDITEFAPLTRQQQVFTPSVPAAGPGLGSYGTVDMVYADRTLGGPLYNPAITFPLTPFMAYSLGAIDPAYIEQGAAPPVLQAPYFVYQATFDGLPRWARYTHAPAVRTPLSPRGVTILTQKGCDVNGAPLFPLVAPAITGLAGLSAFTFNARCIFTGFISAVGDLVGAVNNDREVTLDDQDNAARSAPLTFVSATDTSITWSGIDNVQFPGNATHARIRFSIPIIADDSTEVVVSGPINPFVPISGGSFTSLAAGAGAFSYDSIANNEAAWTIDLPVNSTITEVHAWLKGVSVVTLPAPLPSLRFAQFVPSTGTLSVIASQTDTSASAGAFETQHSIDITGLSTVVNEALSAYQVFLTTGLNANGLVNMYGIVLQVTGAHNMTGGFSIRSIDSTLTHTCWEQLGEFEFVAGVEGGLGANMHIFEAWVPLYPNVTGVPSLRNFEVIYSLPIIIGSPATAKVVGWKTK